MTEKEINWEEVDKKYWIETLTTEFWKTLDSMQEWKWIFTLWHSNHPIEKFIELAQSQNIDMIIDVRLYPRSKYNPQFNKEAFAASLKTVWIDYAYAKVLWGSEWKDTDMNLFERTIERLVDRSRQMRVCLVCSEWDPFPNKYLSSWCHRWWKLTRYIKENYWEEVYHIIKDFSVERTELKRKK